jgi:hypothetical protein
MIKAFYWNVTGLVKGRKVLVEDLMAVSSVLISLVVFTIFGGFFGSILKCPSLGFLELTTESS